MNFRFYYEVLGGHTHVRVFVAPATEHTHGMAGRLVLRNEEWKELAAKLFREGCEIIEEEIPS